MGKKPSNNVQHEDSPYTPPVDMILSQGEQIFMEQAQDNQNNTAVWLTSKTSGLPGKNTSKISKSRKARVYNPEDRFTNAHIKRYYLFPFYYSTLFPYFKISWKVWKPNSVYKKMAQFLSNLPGIPDKTSVQCKSFDQRMKELNYASPPESQKVDLFQAAINYLKEEKLDNSDREVIQKYLKKMNERSQYMGYIQTGSTESEEEIREEKLIVDQKKEETSIESNNAEIQLIFNEFLDVQK